MWSRRSAFMLFMLKPNSNKGQWYFLILSKNLLHEPPFEFNFGIGRPNFESKIAKMMNRGKYATENSFKTNQVPIWKSFYGSIIEALHGEGQLGCRTE